jgi:hypothetical protein
MADEPLQRGADAFRESGNVARVGIRIGRDDQQLRTSQHDHHPAGGMVRRAAGAGAAGAGAAGAGVGEYSAGRQWEQPQDNTGYRGLASQRGFRPGC